MAGFPGMTRGQPERRELAWRLHELASLVKAHAQQQAAQPRTTSASASIRSLSSAAVAVGHWHTWWLQRPYGKHSGAGNATVRICELA